MDKKTKRTLMVGLNWAILGAIVWTVILIIACSVIDKVSASGVDQVEGYNQACLSQVPDTAFEAYE